MKWSQLNCIGFENFIKAAKRTMNRSMFIFSSFLYAFKIECTRPNIVLKRWKSHVYKYQHIISSTGFTDLFMAFSTFSRMHLYKKNNINTKTKTERIGLDWNGTEYTRQTKPKQNKLKQNRKHSKQRKKYCSVAVLYKLQILRWTELCLPQYFELYAVYVCVPDPPSIHPTIHRFG